MKFAALLCFSATLLFAESNAKEQPIGNLVADTCLAQMIAKNGYFTGILATTEDDDDSMFNTPENAGGSTETDLFTDSDEVYRDGDDDDDAMLFSFGVSIKEFYFFY